MAVNQVIYNDEILIDLTEDTVTADTLLEGSTAHDASGNVIVGTLKVPKTFCVELTGSFSENYAYVEVAGSKYAAEETVTVLEGAYVNVYVGSSSGASNRCKIMFNGDSVLSGKAGSYEFTATDNVKIEMNYAASTPYGTAVITMPSA